MGSFFGDIGEYISDRFSSGSLAASRSEDLIRQGMQEAQAANSAAIAQQQQTQAYIEQVTRPYREAGVRALGRLEEISDQGPTGLSPTGRALLTEREAAIDRALAARRLYRSGAAIRAQAGEAERITLEDMDRQRKEQLAALGSILGIGQQATSLASQSSLTGAGLSTQSAQALGQTLASGYGTLAGMPFAQEQQRLATLGLIPTTIGGIGLLAGGLSGIVGGLSSSGVLSDSSSARRV